MQTDLVQRQPNSEQRRNQRLDAEDGSELIPPSFSPGYSASSIQNSRDQPTNEMASAIKRQVCELTAEEKQEIVDLFDEGYSESYIMRKANMSRYNIKQVLYAAGKRGRFIKRNNSVNDGAHASTTVQDCLLTVRSMLERSYWGSSIQRSQDVPEKETETAKTRHAHELTPEDKQEIVDLFDKGHTCCYIIQKTSVSGYYIRQLLSAAGRTFRERKQRRRPATTSPVQYAGQNDQHGTAKTLERKPAVGKKKAMPQQCPVCGNWYSSKKVLKVHHRVHTGEKPFCCGLCPKKFAQSNMLNAHMDSHQDIRKWVCEICKKGFIQSAHLHTHRMAHLGIKRNKKKRLKALASKLLSKAVDNLKGMDIPNVRVDTNSAPVQPFSDQREQDQEVKEYSSTSPDRCVGAATEISFLPSDSEIRSDRTPLYQCQVCRLHWDEENEFLLHLADKPHERLFATGIFLHCTGCKFKTRKPAKMGKHIVKYQSQNAMQDCILHGVTTIH